MVIRIGDRIMIFKLISTNTMWTNGASTFVANLISDRAFMQITRY